MEQDKKISGIADQISPIEEDQLGKISGGFATINANIQTASERGTNTNNAVGCQCTNTNNAVGCSCSIQS